MKAGVVFDLAEGPVWADFIEPQPAPGQTLIDVRAAAMSHVVKARASGRHYSFDGNLPFVPGIDGVGCGRHVLETTKRTAEVPEVLFVVLKTAPVSVLGGDPLHGAGEIQGALVQSPAADGAFQLTLAA